MPLDLMQLGAKPLDGSAPAFGGSTPFDLTQLGATPLDRALPLAAPQQIPAGTLDFQMPELAPSLSAEQLTTPGMLPDAPQQTQEEWYAQIRGENDARVAQGVNPYEHNLKLAADAQYGADDSIVDSVLNVAGDAARSAADAIVNPLLAAEAKLGFETAGDMLANRQAQSDIAGARDQSWVEKMASGVASSLAQSVTLGATGAGIAGNLGKIGAIFAGFGHQAYEQGYREAKKQGATDDEAAKMARASTAFEVGVMGAFQFIGFGGAEKAVSEMLDQAAKKTVTSSLKSFAAQTLAELTEEEITSFGQLYAGNLGMYDPSVDPKTLRETKWETFRDTAVQTLLTMGVMGGAQKAIDFIRKRTRKAATEAGLPPSSVRHQQDIDNLADSVQQAIDEGLIAEVEAAAVEQPAEEAVTEQPAEGENPPLDATGYKDVGPGVYVDGNGETVVLGDPTSPDPEMVYVVPEDYQPVDAAPLAAEPPAAVKVMLTQADKATLRRMGMSDADIARLTPQDAEAIISRAQVIPAPAPAPAEVETEAAASVTPPPETLVAGLPPAPSATEQSAPAAVGVEGTVADRAKAIVRRNDEAFAWWNAARQDLKDAEESGDAERIEAAKKAEAIALEGIEATGGSMMAGDLRRRIRDGDLTDETESLVKYIESSIRGYDKYNPNSPRYVEHGPMDHGKGQAVAEEQPAPTPRTPKPKAAAPKPAIKSPEDFAADFLKGKRNAPAPPAGPVTLASVVDRTVGERYRMVGKEGVLADRFADDNGISIDLYENDDGTATLHQYDLEAGQTIGHQVFKTPALARQEVAKAKAAPIAKQPAADPDVDRLQSTLDRAAPKSGGKVSRVEGGFRVEFAGGRSVALVESEQVETSPEAIDRALKGYGLEDTPENREYLATHVRGSFELRTRDAKRMGADGLIRLRAGLGERAPITLRHELIHFARSSGMIDDAAWSALVDRHAKDAKGAKRQEELIARALETDPKLADKLRQIIDSLLEMMGVDADAARKLERAIRSGTLFAEEKAVGTRIGNVNIRVEKSSAGWVVKKTEGGVTIEMGGDPRGGGYSLDEANEKAQKEIDSELRREAARKPKTVAPAEPAVDPDAMTEEDLAAKLAAMMAEEAGGQSPAPSPPKAPAAPRAPRAPTAKPPAKKPIAEKAASARSELAAAMDDLKDALKEGGLLPSTGFNPKIAGAAAKVAAKAFKAGAYTFAEYVDLVVKEVGPDVTLKIADYLSNAWGQLGKIAVGKVDAPGSVAAILQENGNAQTSDDAGADVEGVQDGAGQPGADAPATPGRAPKDRSATEGAGGKGGVSLPDSGTTEGDVPERTGDQSSRDGATGAPDADQPGLAGSGTAEQPAAGGAGEIQATDAATLNARNHVIEPDDDLATRGEVESLRRNIAAVKLLKKLEDEDRLASPDEKKILAQFSGWGGLSQAFDKIKGDIMVAAEKGDRLTPTQQYRRDLNWEKKWGKAYRTLLDLMDPKEWEAARNTTINAHYTSKVVIQKMWDLAASLGFHGGRVLEPGAGIGHFAGLVPARLRGGSKFVMVEMDSFSSRMLKKLYPEADVHGVPMDKFRAAPGSVDLVIGNVPFADGDQADAFRRYKQGLNLHNYFIARALDAVRPGGLAILISTHHTLDSQIDQRKLLASKGNLVGAIRLPNNAFKDNAKTEVVTDILIFRRPIAGEVRQPHELQEFTSTGEIKLPKSSDGKEQAERINEYFIEHPEMVLGKNSLAGSMRGPDEYTVEPTPGSLDEKLAKAIESLPKDIFGGQQSQGDVVEASPGESTREGYLRADGKKLQMAVGGKWVEIGPGVRPIEGYPKHLFGQVGIARALDYIGLRDAYADLRKTMLDPSATDVDVAKGQKKLDRAYDAYVAKHGQVNGSKTNIFSADPEYYRVLSLEDEKTKYNPETKRNTYVYSKAPVFTKRTLGPRVAPTKADNVKDGLWVSLGFRGKVDVGYIAQLTGTDERQVIADLAEQELAFRDPETLEFHLKERYLSGNVRKKLRQAELAVEDGDQSYQRNVDALQKVQPDPVGIAKINAKLGANWIPVNVVQAFAKQLFKNQAATVTYDTAGDKWTVEVPGGGGREWEVDSVVLDDNRNPVVTIEGQEILEDTLNLRTPKVIYYAHVGELDSKGKPKKSKLVDERASAAAKANANKFQQAFKKLINDNAEIGEQLEQIYNVQFNSYVDAKYDGTHLEMPGADPDIKLRPYQKNAIWRMLQDGYALLAHAVGAGKTYTMIGAAMEMRRLGLAKRPILVVQNATLGQFATSFMRMYPNANVLVADKSDLGTQNRQLFLSRVTSGDWDAIVMAQSTFDRLSSHPDVERGFIDEQMAALEEAINSEGGDQGRKNTPTVKELVKARKKLEERLEKLLDKVSKADANTLYFDDLHPDALFLDEAHAYKKPFFVTKLDNLVGLNKQMSARGVTTMIKVRSIQQKMGGKNVFLATGTPITNTLGELWHMVSFVNPKLNEDFGVQTFDGFIGAFAEKDTVREMNAGGQWVFKDALVKFVNGPELMHYLRESWDILSPDDLRAYMSDSEKEGKGLPVLKGGKVQAITVERTPGAEKFMDFVEQVYQRFKDLPGKLRREFSYIPAVAYGAAKAASLDIRLIFPGAKEEAGSKIEQMVNQAIREYQDSTETKGTQLIFSDTFNPRSMDTLNQFMSGAHIDMDVPMADAVDNEDAETEAEVKALLFQDIKKKLIARGVPAHEIALVAEAKTDAQREALFERVKSGDVRFLLGSSQKMGVGVNVQTKIVAIHHLDAPWLPADVEQREGRGVRWGNENAEIAIYRYAMTKTLDAAIFTKTVRKGKFIWQVMAGKIEGREFEDPASEMTMSVEEQLAAIAGEPLLFEKMDLDRQKRDLELERESFTDAVARNRQYVRTYREDVKRLTESAIPRQQLLLAEINALATDKPSLQVGDDVYTTAEEINAAFDAVRKLHEDDILNAVKEKKLQYYEPSKFQVLAADKFEYLSEPIKLSGQTAHISAGAWPEFNEGQTEWKHGSVVAISVASNPHVNLYDGNATTGYGLAQQAMKLPERMEQAIASTREQIAKREAEIAELEGLTDRKWSEQERLDAITERLAVIEAELVAKSEAEAARKKAQSAAREEERKRQAGGDISPSGDAAARAPGGGGVSEQPFARTEAGGMGTILRGLPVPELVVLAKEILGGKTPTVKRLRKALGRFNHMERAPASAKILLDPRTAKNENQLAAVLAHEIGHAIDYLPEGVMKRGNILGRIGSLHRFMRGYLIKVGQNKVIREELIELTKWWSGTWDEKTQPRYAKYRKSSRELYAEALSVFLNAPGQLEWRAPNFWKGFTELLTKKPAVLKAYLEVQELLNGTPASLAAARSERIREMFNNGDQAIRAAMNARAAAQSSTVESVKQALEQGLLERAAPVRKRVDKVQAAGRKISDADNAYYILDELNTIDAANHIMLGRIQREFYEPALEQGFTLGDIGEYLFLRRIVNERNEILNPLGFTPSAAKETMAGLKERLGDDAFKRLEGAMGLWHDIVFKSVEEAVDAGVYNREQFEKTIKPNKDNYATFAVTHYLENDAHIPAAIMKQIGTLEEVANPLDATHLKTITLNRLTQLNKAKSVLRDFMRRSLPNEITAVEIPYGKREPSKPARPGMDYLIVLEDGKPAAYEVPMAIAKSFTQHDIGGLAKVGRVLESKVYGWFHPLFVTFNPGFQVQNPPRDLRRTHLNLGAIGHKLHNRLVAELTEKFKKAGKSDEEAKRLAEAGAKPAKITLGQLFKAYWQAIPAAHRRAAGIQDKTIDELTEQHVLDVPFVSVDPAVIDEEGATKYLLESHGLKSSENGHPPRSLKALAAKVGGIIEAIGVFQETLPKVAGYRLMTDRQVAEHERGFIVRKYVGTPDYKQRGLATGITNSLWMYSKVRANGLQWDMDLATDKDTAAAWWWRRMVWTIMPTTFTKAAMYGLMGPGVAAMMAAIPKYFINSYDILPIGWLMGDDDDEEKDKSRGKVVFVTVAQDDTGRLLKSIYSQLLDMAAEAAGLDARAPSAETVGKELLGGLQQDLVGGFNPIIDIGLKWAQFARGVNPRDEHFGSEIVPRTEWDAQGWPATKAMLSWTLDKFGVLSTIGHTLTGPMLGSPFESGEETTVETVSRSVPGLSRMLRISDRGYSESQWADMEAEEQERARFKLGLPKAARDATKLLYQLQRRVDALSAKEADRKLLLQKWYNKSYIPLTQAMQNPGADEKALKAQLAESVANATTLYMGDVAADFASVAILSRGPEFQEGEETQQEFAGRVAKWKQDRKDAIAWLKAHVKEPGVDAALNATTGSDSYNRIMKLRTDRSGNLRQLTPEESDAQARASDALIEIRTP